MRSPQRASRRGTAAGSAGARGWGGSRRSARRGGALNAAQKAHSERPHLAPTPAPASPASGAAAAAAPSPAAGRAGDAAEAGAHAHAAGRSGSTLGDVAAAVLMGRAEDAAALLDAGTVPQGRASTVLLYAACAEAPLQLPAGRDQKSHPAAAAMRATMAALLSRRAIRDEALPCGSGITRVSATLARRGLWDRALLLASDASGKSSQRTHARAALLAVAAERGAAAPLAALLAALERKALSHLRRPQSASRRAAAVRDARGLARTLCALLLPLLTRPPADCFAVYGGVAEERAHCVALVGAAARRLRAAAAGDDVAPPPPLADLPDSDSEADSDDSDDESDDDADASDAEGPTELGDVLPSRAALFPAPAAAHDADCAAVAESLAAGVPFAWSVAGHASCPPAFRAAARAAACALRAAGMPPELLPAVVGRAAEAQLWPGLRWGEPGVAAFIHTPPPTSLAELERRC